MLVSAGAPSVVAAQLVTSTAGAALAVFAKAPSILWPLPLHEELVRAALCLRVKAHTAPARTPPLTGCVQSSAGAGGVLFSGHRF